MPSNRPPNSPVVRWTASLAGLPALSVSKTQVMNTKT
jgi:hypothetical protein